MSKVIYEHEIYIACGVCGALLLEDSAGKHMGWHVKLRGRLVETGTLETAEILGEVIKLLAETAAKFESTDFHAVAVVNEVIETLKSERREIIKNG